MKGVPHAFDKKPNPVSFPKSAERCYSEACAELKRVFGGHVGKEERRQLEREERVVRFEEGELSEPGDLTKPTRSGEFVSGEMKGRRNTTTEEDIQRMLNSDGGDKDLDVPGEGDERADIVHEMNRGFGEGKPQIHITGDDGERSGREGKKERKRSASNPGKMLKLENMI